MFWKKLGKSKYSVYKISYKRHFKSDFLWKFPQGEADQSYYIVPLEDMQGCTHGCKLKLILFSHSLLLAWEAIALILEIKRILTCISPPVQQTQDPVIIQRNCWQSNYYLTDTSQSIKIICRKQQKQKRPKIKKKGQLFFIGKSWNSSMLLSVRDDGLSGRCSVS